MADEEKRTQDVVRTVVLAGFAILALMGSSTLGVMLYLFVQGRDVPQGLSIVFTGTAGVLVSTFSSLVKDYVGRVRP